MLFEKGHNGFAQLGQGNSCQTAVPTIIAGSLAGKKVIQVAAGSHHSGK
jgi:RCC1 and BTB domain-containing protein